MKNMKFTRLMILVPFVMASPLALSAEEGAKPETKESDQTAKPEAGTIAALVSDGVTFSILSKALDASGLKDTFAGKGPFTVFAPTDEAFGKLPDGALEKLLLPENKEKLRALLLHHVIPGRMLSSSLQDGEIKTSAGDMLEIDVDGGKVEVGDAKVANADVAATNGVVHVIDRVVVPESLDGFAGLDDD